MSHHATHFYLHPSDGVPTTTAEERFASMSVTRSASAVIAEPKRVRATRVPTSLCVDDIAGARPRTLPPRPRAAFHDTGDIEGARPKLLHRESSYVPGYIERASLFARRSDWDAARPARVGQRLTPAHPLPPPPPPPSHARRLPPRPV